MIEIIDDFLPVSKAQTLRDCFKTGHFDRVEQSEAGAYESRFRVPEITQPSEVYTASFWRSEELSNSSDVQNIVAEYFMKEFEKHMSRIGHVRTFCYKMGCADHYRIHLDHEIATVGITYYLTPGWVPDWGGLLHVFEGIEIKTICPKFNRTVVMRHQEKIPHFVSQIMPFAFEQRYILNAFALGELK